MKNIGLNINIGAKIGSAMGGLQKLSSSTTSLGAKMTELGNKRIDIIANDESVLKAKSSIESVGKKLDELKKHRTELNLSLDKTKVTELNNSIGKIEDKIDKLSDEENIINLKIKATTDEKELKKLNKSLANTQKKSLELSKQKLGLKDELREVKKVNEKVNKELKNTDSNIKDLNAKKLTLKDELKEAENQAEKTNRAVNKIDKSIRRINGSKIKIAHIVERREIIKREFHDNLSKIAQTGAVFSGIAYGMNAINKETVKMANLSATVGLKFEDVKSLDAVVKGIDLNYEHVIDTMEELNNAVGEGKALEEEWLKGDRKKEFKLIGKLDDVFKGMDFSLSDESFKGLNYQKQFSKFSKMAQDEQYKLVFDTALKMPDKQKAASMVDILMGGESNKILSHMRSLGKSYDEILDRGKKLNYLNDEALDGAKAYAKVSAETSSIMGSMFQQIAGIGGSFMTPLLKDFNEYLILNKDIIQADIKGFFRGIGSAIGEVGETIKLVSEKVSPFLDLFRSEDTSADDMTFGMDDIGAKGQELGSTLTWIGTGLASLVGGKMVLGTLAMGIGIVSQAIRILGVVATISPIGLAVAGIATVGYLIYDNWNSISTWWTELWSDFGTTISEEYGWIKTLFEWSPLGVIVDAWTPITTFMSDLWSGMSLADAGEKLIGSFVQGITKKWHEASKAIGAIADTVGDWFSWDDEEEKRPVGSKMTSKPVKMATAGFMVGSSLAAASPELRDMSPFVPSLRSSSLVGEKEKPLTLLTSRNSEQNNTTVTVNFGDTNINNTSDEAELHRNIEKSITNALREHHREKQSIRTFD